MKKNIVLYSLVAILSILLLSSKSRKVVANSVNDQTINKLSEMKNVLADFKRNQADYQ